MKEIGVRKVLGAKIGHIAYVINRQYIFILLIATVLGSAAGYVGTDQLMSSIWSYYVQLGPSAIALSFGLLLIISIVTVGHRVFVAANANPAQTLRDE